MAWVVIANLKGAPGDAAALDLFDQVLNAINGVDQMIDEMDMRTLGRAASADYAIPLGDVDGYVSAGVKRDGTFNFSKPPTVAGSGGVVFEPISTPGWAWAFADRDGYVAFGLRSDGTVHIHKGAGGGGITAMQAASTALGYSKSLSTVLEAIGDSLTAGYFGGSPGPASDSWPSKLAPLIPGVTVNNLAVSGYTVDEESVRIGALPVPLTVVGGSLPASGSVQVSTTAVIGWREADLTRVFNGTLAGVPGTLTRTNSDTVFTFARTSSGTAVQVAPGTPFKPEYHDHNEGILVVLLGRNNVTYDVRGEDASVSEHVLKGLQRIEQWHARDLKKVLFLSIPTNVSETQGTPRHGQVMEINAGMENLFSTRYLDVRRWLIDNGLEALGITPTAEDTAAINADTMPPSLMEADGGHWSSATCGLVAQRVEEYLSTREWI